MTHGNNYNFLTPPFFFINYKGNLMETGFLKIKQEGESKETFLDVCSIALANFYENDGKTECRILLIDVENTVLIIKDERSIRILRHYLTQNQLYPEL